MIRASILIATRDNPGTLAGAVRHALAQEPIEGSFEVVVVDDQSKAAQLAVLDAIEQEHAAAIESGVLRINRLREHAGLSKGRNVASRMATGEFLCYMDGDAYARPDWLARVLEPFTDPTVGAVGSRVVFAYAPEVMNGQGCTLNRYGEGKDLYCLQPIDNAPDTSADVLYAMGCGMVMRRSCWEQTGGFDESIIYAYDDAELCLCIWELGLRVVTAPAALVRHDTIAYSRPTRGKMFHNMRNRWLTVIKHWPASWIAIEAVLQLGSFVRSPSHLLHALVFMRAMQNLAPSVGGALRYRRSRRRGAAQHWIPLLAPQWGGGPAMSFDSRLAANAPLTPIARVDWSDWAYYRPVGALRRPDDPGLWLVRNGYTRLALFSSSRKVAVSARALQEGVTLVVRRPSGEELLCRELPCEATGFDLDLPGALDEIVIVVRCRDDEPVDPMRPSAVAQLVEVCQS